MLSIALATLVLATPALGADSFGDLNDVVLVRVYDGDPFCIDIPELHPLIDAQSIDLLNSKRHDRSTKPSDR